MTDLTGPTIAALRAVHDDLAARAVAVSDEELEATSGAELWTVAQVLSHLGSGAEIGLATHRAAVEGGTPPDQAANREVWARWDALGPREQADAFVVADAAFVEFVEGLDAAQRQTEVDLGFMPHPLPLSATLGMRLNELSMHAWDVRVATDPAAAVGDEADLLLAHFSSDLGFLLGFSGKADALGEPAVIAVAGTDLGLEIADTVRLTRPESEPTATLNAPSEAVIRLLSGRLRPEVTPAEVSLVGNVDLDDLRRVFPGY